MDNSMINNTLKKWQIQLWWQGSSTSHRSQDFPGPSRIPDPWSDPQRSDFQASHSHYSHRTFEPDSSEAHMTFLERQHPGAWIVRTRDRGRATNGRLRRGLGCPMWIACAVVSMAMGSKGEMGSDGRLTGKGYVGRNGNSRNSEGMPMAYGFQGSTILHIAGCMSWWLWSIVQGLRMIAW